MHNGFAREVPFSQLKKTTLIEKVLHFGKAPIRVLVSPDGLWFAAKDVFNAVNQVTDRTILACFAPEHLRLLPFQMDQGPLQLTAVSPLGVATIAARLPFPLCRILDGWLRKVVRPLEEEYGTPRLGWTLLADGRLPVRHRKYSDNEDRWFEVKFRHPHGEPRAANLHEPALFDDDPDLPPYDPDALRAAPHRHKP